MAQTEIPAAIKAVLKDIASGTLGVTKSCRNHKIGTTTFFEALCEFPEVEEQYIRARLFRSHMRYESIDEITEDLRMGLIDANTARVLIDTIKWQTGKENKGLYADKAQEQPATVTNNMIITSQVLDLLGQDQLEALRLKLGAPNVIDHVPDVVTPES